MANNVELAAGSGGDIIRTIDLSGVETPVTKICVGGLSTESLIGESGVTLPISGTVTANLSATDNAVLDAIAASVAGTLTVGSHAVTNAGTFVVQVDGTALTRLTDIETNTNFGAVTGGGVEASALRVTLASDSTGVLTVDGTVTANAGTNLNTSALALEAGNIATAATLLGTIDADTGSIATSATSIDGKITACNTGAVVISSGTVTANLSTTDNNVLDAIETNTSKSTSHYRNIDANAEAEIKGSAGTLHWIQAINLTAAIAYLHLYDNTAASVTPGSDTPTYTFPIPTAGSTNGAGFVLRLEQAFATGITLVVTTTVDGSAGDPGTNGVMINAGYT